MATYQRLIFSVLRRLRELNQLFAEALADPDTHLAKQPDDAYLTALLSKDLGARISNMACQNLAA